MSKLNYIYCPILKLDSNIICYFLTNLEKYYQYLELLTIFIQFVINILIFHQFFLSIHENFKYPGDFSCEKYPGDHFNIQEFVRSWTP